MTEHIRKHERVVLESWLADAARAIGLGGWRLYLEPTPVANEDHDAEIHISSEADVGTIWISAAWRDQPEPELRHALTHELCHMHVERLWGMAGELTSELGSQAERLADEALRLEVERTTDRLAAGFAPFLPALVIPGPVDVIQPPPSDIKG